MGAKIFKRDRPTIGVLAGWSSHEGATSDHYRDSVMLGIQSAARSRGCHLLLSWGIRQITDLNNLYPSWPVVSSVTDFIPIGPWNTDGLIFYTPLANESQSAYIQKLRAEGFPVLFIATGEKGPAITVNNEMGIEQAVHHLAEHGHRRIAFLAGRPTDKGDSDLRLQAYHSAVAKYNLTADPHLVAWGWHAYTEGYKAMQELLGSQVKFTAVLASNDNSALGAMRAVREANLKIPQDIAIIGFDDQPRSIAQVPPLASVHVPLNMIGEQSVLVMLDYLAGKAQLESVVLPTRLVRRESCGCIPDVVTSAVNVSSTRKKPGSDKQPGNARIHEIQQELVNEMLGALPSELRFPSEEQIRRICANFVEAFWISLKEQSTTTFQAAFRESIQLMEMADFNIDYWQEMISFLRREMVRLPANWKLVKTRTLAEDMLHQARAIIGESLQRQDPRHQYQRALFSGALYEITSRLSTALSDAQLIKLLNTHIIEINIPHARVLLFEPELEDTVAWSVLAVEDPGLSGQRFRSREFPPPGLYPPDEILNVYMLPLVFQSEVLGYVALGGTDPGACEVIARQLAATIKVSRLHERVVELSLTDPLTGLFNRRYQDLFMKSEIARSHRFSHNLSIIMADIDRFKEYNDLYGHPAGDQALKAIANCLTTNRRIADVVARSGGEEFVLILPETEIKGALHVAEKLQALVATVPGLRRPITLSLGISVLNDQIHTAEALLQQADQALYEAKRTGRNKVCIFQAKV